MQLKFPMDPFGEVNVFPQPDGSTNVEATILVVPAVAGAVSALAIDGSASMKGRFGAEAPPGAAEAGNLVRPVAASLATELAAFSAGQQTTVLYWGCGPDGSDLEPVGPLSLEEAADHAYDGPERFGTGRQLLPLVRHLVEQLFETSPRSVGVVLVDGPIGDMDAVVAYSMELSVDLAAGRRNPLTLVLVSIGDGIDVGQLQRLDDLDVREGAPANVWDHKLAEYLRYPEEIFAELVDASTVALPEATVLDDRGRTVREFPDGLPGVFAFTLPAGSKSFTLLTPDDSVEQPIVEETEEFDDLAEENPAGGEGGAS